MLEFVALICPLWLKFTCELCFAVRCCLAVAPLDYGWRRASRKSDGRGCVSALAVSARSDCRRCIYLRVCDLSQHPPCLKNSTMRFILVAVRVINMSL